LGDPIVGKTDHRVAIMGHDNTAAFRSPREQVRVFQVLDAFIPRAHQIELGQPAEQAAHNKVIEVIVTYQR
jgi:hypothetical protein